MGNARTLPLSTWSEVPKLECGTDICRACTLERGSLWKWKGGWALCGIRHIVLNTEFEGDQWQTSAAGEASVHSENV